MKGLSFSKKTSTIALVFFTIYALYGIFKIPVIQYLVSLACGGIAYGMSGSYEIAVLVLLVMNLVYPLLTNATGTGFKDVSGVDGFQDASGADAFEDASGSDTFEDVSGADLDAFEDASGADVQAVPVEGATGPLPLPVYQPAETFKGSQSQNNESLFKLGQIPKDVKGGFHIDAGTTVMNALNSLKPDQLKSMTSDTKQLIETQKSLMSMLQTFSPMVTEGKQMMDTFQSMFPQLKSA